MKRAPLAALLLLVAGSRAEAQPTPQPVTELAFQNLTALRVNPLGLVDLADLSFRLRLYESDSPALTQNFVGLGVAAGLSPAWGRLGILAEVQPLTLLKLWASYEAIAYYGTFDLMASFPTAGADFSDTAIDDRSDAEGTESYSALGSQLNLGATLQAKVGPFAVRDLFRVFRASFDLRDGDRVFYDQLFDLLVPDEGWAIVNDVDLLFVTTFGLAAGVRWTYATPLYHDFHYGEAAPVDGRPANDLHRLGPLLAYSLSKKTDGRFHSPTAILIAQWHLSHRWRTGEDVSGALPYLALAFQFRGNLLAED